MRKYTQKICRIIKFKRSLFLTLANIFHAVCCLEKEHHIWMSVIFFSIILIICNIILEMKAKSKPHDYQNFRYCIFTNFVFYILCIFRVVLSCWNWSFINGQFSVSKNKIYIVIACCTCNKKTAGFQLLC